MKHAIGLVDGCLVRQNPILDPTILETRTALGANRLSESHQHEIVSEEKWESA